MTYDIRAISDFKIQFSLNLAHKIFRNDALVGLNYRLFALLNDCLTLPFSFFRSFAWNHTLP